MVKGTSRQRFSETHARHSDETWTASDEQAQLPRSERFPATWKDSQIFPVFTDTENVSLRLCTHDPTTMPSWLQESLQAENCSQWFAETEAAKKREMIILESILILCVYNWLLQEPFAYFIQKFSSKNDEPGHVKTSLFHHCFSSNRLWIVTKQIGTKKRRIKITSLRKITPLKEKILSIKMFKIFLNSSVNFNRALVKYCLKKFFYR